MFLFFQTHKELLYKVLLTHSHTMTGPGKKPFENTVGKGEIACTSNFSFPHNVFNSIKDRNYHFCYTQFVVCKCFQFGLVQNLLVREWVKGQYYYQIFLCHVFFSQRSKTKSLYGSKLNLLPNQYADTISCL